MSKPQVSRRLRVSRFGLDELIKSVSSKKEYKDFYDRSVVTEPPARTVHQLEQQRLLDKYRVNLPPVRRRAQNHTPLVKSIDQASNFDVLPASKQLNRLVKSIGLDDLFNTTAEKISALKVLKTARNDILIIEDLFTSVDQNSEFQAQTPKQILTYVQEAFAELSQMREEPRDLVDVDKLVSEAAFIYRRVMVGLSKVSQVGQNDPDTSQ